MNVYRVQDTQGRGPYKRGFTEQWMDATHHDRNEPIPPAHFNEPLRDNAKRMALGFGFVSMQSLHRWFSQQELGWLFARGYRIVRLRSCRCLAESKQQVLFGRRQYHHNDLDVIAGWANVYKEGVTA